MTRAGEARGIATNSVGPVPLSFPGMSLQPDLTRKVRQLDNDVQDIYALLTGISATQMRQANRLEEIAATQVEHGGTLGELAAKQAELAATQAELAGTQAEQGGKLDAILDLLRRSGTD